ncbi:MAG: hypothetical protein M3R40_12065 [Pseudomonadota bacterium]|nr:hypothetical protein [Pseudomonadota bacterium]
MPTIYGATAPARSAASSSDRVSQSLSGREIAHPGHALFQVALVNGVYQTNMPPGAMNAEIDTGRESNTRAFENIATGSLAVFRESRAIGVDKRSADGHDRHRESARAAVCTSIAWKGSMSPTRAASLARESIEWPSAMSSGKALS